MMRGKRIRKPCHKKERNLLVRHIVGIWEVGTADLLPSIAHSGPATIEIEHKEGSVFMPYRSFKGKFDNLFSSRANKRTGIVE